MTNQLIMSGIFHFGIVFQEGEGMKNEQVVNPQLEQLQTECWNLEIEELEPIVAPGNTWSV